MTVIRFPQTYWGTPQEQLDREFLEELQHLGARGPGLVARTLWAAFQATPDLDERRVLTTRIVGEFAQIAEIFCLLILSMRRRADHPILATFVDHRTQDVLAVMDELGALGDDLDIGGLLHAPPPRHRPENQRLFAAIIAAARQLVSVFALQDAVFRRFYTKSKHGFVIVRSMSLAGPPFFGPNEDAGVWALYRTPPGEDPALGGQLASVGFRALPELVERLVTSCTVLSNGAIHLAGLVRGGIEQRAI